MKTLNRRIHAKFRCWLLLLFGLQALRLFGQENNRIALVIGNSTYLTAPLINPSNDAELVASTLESLGFDVLLSTDIKTKDIFVSKINEFGQKRSDYDVGLVYYAGHGIQIGSENYLLPTDETFESEFDVEDNGVNVQKIMRYLRAIDDQVNILILDACRNNPFESNWNSTRSLSKSTGLAKIEPPTGSIIAFSTEVGQTAPDGSGDNSIYSASLCRNMLVPDISIDQVFRNVRAEVLSQTQGQQRPIESTQLTGQTFYLRSLADTRKLEELEARIRQTRYDEALTRHRELFGSSILDFDNARAVRLKGEILDELIPEVALAFWDSAFTEYPEDEDVFEGYLKSSLKRDSVSLAKTLIREYSTKRPMSMMIADLTAFIAWHEIDEKPEQFEREAVKSRSILDKYAGKGNTEAVFRLCRLDYFQDDFVAFKKHLSQFLNFDNCDYRDLIELDVMCSRMSLLALGEGLTEEKEWNELEQHFFQFCIDRFPDVPVFYVSKSLKFLSGEHQDLLRVRELCNAALEINPNDNYALQVRGAAFYNEAYDCLDRNAPEDSASCSELALRAIADNMAALEFGANKKGGYCFVGNIYYHLLNDPASAIYHFEKSIVEDSTWTKPYQQAADAAYDLSLYDKGLDFATCAINCHASERDFMNDDEWASKQAELLATKFYHEKALERHADAYASIKESYSLDRRYRTYDLLAAAIFQEDLDFAISESKSLFKQTNDPCFKIFQALALELAGESNRAQKVFDALISSQADIATIQDESRLPWAFDLCAQYYLARGQYALVVHTLAMSEDWWREYTAEIYYSPGNYYLTALAFYKQNELIRAFAEIEKAILTISELGSTETDETGYLPLTSDKIFALKSEIESSLDKRE